MIHRVDPTGDGRFLRLASVARGNVRENPAS
jgi:hypothetical protein